MFGEGEHRRPASEQSGNSQSVFPYSAAPVPDVARPAAFSSGSVSLPDRAGTDDALGSGR